MLSSTVREFVAANRPLLFPCGELPRASDRLESQSVAWPSALRELAPFLCLDVGPPPSRQPERDPTESEQTPVSDATEGCPAECCVQKVA